MQVWITLAATFCHRSVGVRLCVFKQSRKSIFAYSLEKNIVSNFLLALLRGEIIHDRLKFNNSVDEDYFLMLINKTSI